MAQTKTPKERLGPLRITDDDVDNISLDVINDSGATNNQVPQWSETEGKWQPQSLPAGSTFVDNETPAGLKNGINKDFTIAYLPSPPASIQLFLGGMLLAQGIGNDYTVQNQTITFLTAPSPNDTIVAFYRR
jgi:hypothetical protein